MAESRREKRFLRLSIFCIGSAASAAITGPLDRGNAGSLDRGIAGPLVPGNAGLWLGVDDDSLVSGRCRPLDRGDAGLWIGAMPAFGSGHCRSPGSGHSS